MDIKSILRVFRFAELQTKAERDPDAKRPPTVKFLALALVLGLLLVLISFWSAPRTDMNGALPLGIEAPSESSSVNQTAPPTPEGQAGPAPHASPSADWSARTQDPS